MYYKNNPTIEGKKRLNMAYSLLREPQIIETIQKTGGHFFHGTNANALPYILKYGINSVDTSLENNISVNTGETWSRIQGKRNFVSITDCLNDALRYANMEPNGNIDNMLNFGVVLGITLENMEGIETMPVKSDLPEIAIAGNVPVNHIKFLAVPQDKVEFVRKMIGSKSIAVISMDMKDKFYDTNFQDKFNILERGETGETEKTEQAYPTYAKDDVMPVIKNRKTSKIKEMFENFKKRICSKGKETKERG